MAYCPVKLSFHLLVSVMASVQVGATSKSAAEAAAKMSRTERKSQLESVRVRNYSTSTDDLTITQTNSTSRAAAIDFAHRIAGPGVVVTDAEMTSGDVSQFGFFQGGVTSLSLNSGIVLSTGYVGGSIAWANNSEPQELPFTYPGDAALDRLTLSNQTTYDVAALTIQFTCPVNSLVSVSYAFGSMEYPDVGQWDDVAAVWLANASEWVNGEKRVNVALVEDGPVSVSRINCDKRLRDQGAKTYCQYLQGNRDDNARGGIKGFTVPLSSIEMRVAAGVPYKMQFAVADGYDGRDSSWLFVEEHSLACLPYTDQPSGSPSFSPTDVPSAVPSQAPTLSQEPSMLPSKPPSLQPSTGPTSHPSSEPSPFPSVAPSGTPSSSPTSSFSPTVHITELGTCYERVAKTCQSACDDQTKTGRAKAQRCVRTEAQKRCTAGVSFEARSAYWNKLYESFERKQCGVPRKEDDTIMKEKNDFEPVSNTPKRNELKRKDGKSENQPGNKSKTNQRHREYEA
jgi:hypothetical protein